MKKYIILLLFTTLLFSCGKSDIDLKSDEISLDVKRDFLIETKTFGEFFYDIFFRKSGKISGVSEFDINSLSSGRISSINFKEGDRVKSGDLLVRLNDNTMNYGLGVERAKNNLERVEINYESTIISLDKSIKDAQINYENSKNTHNLLIRDLEERIKKAKFDLEESMLDNTNSTSSLDIQKLESDLKKANLEYDTSILNDKNQLESIFTNIRNTKKSIDLIYFDIQNYLDEIFGVSEKNRNKNNSFEIYLSAKNSSLKSEAQSMIRTLIVQYDSFKNIDTNIDESNYTILIDSIEETISQIIKTTDISKQAVINSVESSTFSEARINQIYQTILTYENNINNINSSYLNNKNSLVSFLNTFNENRESRFKSIEILKEQINIAKRQIDNQSFNLENAYERLKIDAQKSIDNSLHSKNIAKLNLENAIKNKDVTIKSLQNQINEAKTSFKEANINYGKLNIYAPVSGFIKEIYVDEGQEVNSQSAILKLVSDKNSKIEVFLSKTELEKVALGDDVYIEYGSNNILGKISSISNVASSDFTFKTTISISSDISIFGDFAWVEFINQSGNNLIPLSLVDIISNQKGTVNIYLPKENTFLKKEVDLGSVYDENIEVFGIDNDDIIITSDISNYNPEDFVLKNN